MEKSQGLVRWRRLLPLVLLCLFGLVGQIQASTRFEQTFKIVEQPRPGRPYITIEMVYYDWTNGSNSFFLHDSGDGTHDGPAIWVDGKYICSPDWELAWPDTDKTGNGTGASREAADVDGWWGTRYTKAHDGINYVVRFWNPYESCNVSKNRKFSVRMCIYMGQMEVGATHTVRIKGKWKINERINKLHEWTDPIEQFGSDVGTALGESLRTGESMAEGMEEALRKVALAWGQTTIKIIEELMMQRVKQKLLNKAMQHEETAHQTTMAAIEQSGAASRQAIAEATGDAKVVTEQVTNATIEGEQVAHNVNVLAEDTSMATSENAVNTSRAAGKTLADLGWWGIPLVAVIVALLNMLLQAALAKGSRKSNNANTKVNTKLVSGMLTYDEGNVSSYVGTDGHVYNARRADIPQGTSLITSPIATTVNGQPSLVAERGPEIVIGRRTTRHIMLNEPSLLQHLAALDHHRTAARYRPYDDGNIADLITSNESGRPISGAQSSADEQTRQTLEALTAAVIALQARLAQPIEAKINKYGTGGLIDEVQSGMKFMNKYKG